MHLQKLEAKRGRDQRSARMEELSADEASLVMVDARNVILFTLSLSGLHSSTIQHIKENSCSWYRAKRQPSLTEASPSSSQCLGYRVAIVQNRVSSLSMMIQNAATNTHSARW
jgi:hypothetical protein